VPPAEWLGKTPTELWPSEDADVQERALESALRGGVVDILEEWHGPRAVEHLHSLYFPIQREGRAPMAGSVSIDVSPLIEAQAEARQTAERLRQTLDGTVLAMSHVVETRDPYTAGHERRVAELVVAIGAEMGLSGEDLEGVRVAALIHDIGKIAVPAEILTRPGRLSKDEFRLIMQHPEAGHDIVAGIDFGRPVAEMILQHHERLDGSGYPAGLSGDEIMPAARILAAADVVEAMASHRPYRPSMGVPAALDEIRSGAGTRYDADVSAACLAVFEQRGFAFTT
jgi:putative nucleotidyltransferase with HDIG domain